MASNNKSLLISFDDASGSSMGQIYSVTFSSDSDEEHQLTEWLRVAIKSKRSQGLGSHVSQSMRSLGSSASLETTASAREKKKGLFGGFKLGKK